MLEEGKLYTNDISDLAVYVSKVLEDTENSIKIIGGIYNKFSQLPIEVTNTYELKKSSIKDWYELKLI